MATPKLKPGDTFVYTEELAQSIGSTSLTHEEFIGKTIRIFRVNSMYEGATEGGEQFCIRTHILDAYLPDPETPRTLDDVKEGDKLVAKDEPDFDIVGRAGQVVHFYFFDPKLSKERMLGTRTIENLKAKGYRFHDQPQERWKPEVGEWYDTVSEFGEVNEASWRDDNIDNKRWKLGNCFKKDSAEAQKAAEDLKAWWLDRINNQK